MAMDEKKAPEQEQNMDETKVLVQWLKTVDLLDMGKGQEWNPIPVHINQSL
jgi:hypothetical protein